MVCFGKDCNDESLHFIPPPGKIVVNAALSSDLSWPTATTPAPPSRVPSRLGLGLGLGLPLLAAIVGGLFFWNRHRSFKGPMHDRHNFGALSHSWPLPNNINASHASNSDAEMHLNAWPNQIGRMDTSRVHVPELGDTGKGGHA